MTEEIYSQYRINCSCRIKVESKKPKSDIAFEEIVKFLNDQKAVMDYAGLN